MQKFVFAVQVLGLIIIIPVYVFLEINHRLPDNNNHTHVKHQVEKPIIQLILTTETRNENSRPQNSILIQQPRPVRATSLVTLAKADRNHINN